MNHRSQKPTSDFFRKFGFFALFTILFTLVGVIPSPWGFFALFPSMCLAPRIGICWAGL